MEVDDNPQEITRQEYWAIRHALKKRAIAYNRAAGRKRNFAYWFSDASYPCGLPHPPSDYHQRSGYGANTRHFLPWSCDCKERLVVYEKEETICVVRAVKGGKYHYYLTTHRIGRCPWKRA